jgi:hypothetical protein
MHESFEPSDHGARGREVLLAWVLALAIWAIAMAAVAAFLWVRG